MRLLQIGLILFAVSGVAGQPKHSSPAKPTRKPPSQAALSENSFSAGGTTNEQMLRNLYLGNFAELSMERDALLFGVLYSQYLNAYAQRCASSLPADKVEITRDVCVRERYTVNGYGVRVGSAVCVEYRQEGTGLYADPAMYAAKLKLAQLAESNSWRNTMRIIGQAQDNPFAPAMEMLNTSTATDQDLNLLVQANGCKSPALRRFQENLRLYALGKQPIRLGGPKQTLTAAGAPVSTDYRRLLEDLVFDYAKTWAMNRYVSGSVTDVNVSRDERGRPSRVAARYQYVGFNGNSQGSVTLEFADGYPECMYFFDYPSVCKTPNRKIIAAYENGSYRAPEVVKPATVVAEKREAPIPALVPAPKIEAPPAPVAVLVIEESDPEPAPDDFGDVEIHAEMRVRSKVRLDVQPSNALVLVRGVDDTFKYAGLASKYSGAERLWLDDGPQLLLLRKKGWRDHVIRLTIADDGEEIIRVSLTADVP
jgi:hypothetical protein